METKILIIGAGMAGLTAARELRSGGVDFAVLEAQDAPGGRARTITGATGLPVDLGAHWLHGEDNPLKDMLDEYGIAYAVDDAHAMRCYSGGAMEKVDAGRWLTRYIDRDKARRIEEGTLADCPLPELAANEEGARMLGLFGRMWDGIDPPLFPSAREFLTDENAPGGLQPEGGIGALTTHMLHDIGARIRYGTPVVALVSDEGGVRAVAESGEEFYAKKAIFTGSLGVIKSGLVEFRPKLSAAMREELAGLAMGRMNKIVLELPPEFFARRAIPENFSLELLDDDPPHFCHVRGAGLPFITLFASGAAAARMEHLAGEEAVEYVRKALAPVEELRGFEMHVVGAPIVSAWVGNPYTLGAYSACLPGGSRSWLREEANVYFAGDTFDTRFPASLAGAARSGKVAARMAAYALTRKEALAKQHA
ncbi:MAG: NAD(P)/FAD-dependent oxidoreductase [Alphaproteobacteria bacterium]